MICPLGNIIINCFVTGGGGDAFRTIGDNTVVVAVLEGRGGGGGVGGVGPITI